MRAIWSWLLRGAAALLLAGAAQAGAATITVTVGTDGPLTVDANCTFREAVLRARAVDPTNYGCGIPSVASDEIRFGAGVTQVTLTEGSMQVDTTILFTGPVIIDGGGNGSARALSGTGGPSVLTFTGITFRNFNNMSSHGGVMDITSGDVSITNCNFTNNRTQGDGGAIHFSGNKLSIDGLGDGPVAFTGNQAQTAGGALYVHAAGDFLVTGPVQFTSNTAGQIGGAIAIGGVGALGKVNLVGANFTLNRANGDGDGSAYYGGGALYVTGGGSIFSLILVQECAFELNEAPDGSGGAIFNQGVMSWPDTIDDLDDLHAGGIFNCYFLQNKASGDDGPNDGLGGAIYSNGPLSVLGSTFDSNESASDGGAIVNRQSWSVDEERLRVVNSTFSANVAGANGGAISIRPGAGALLLQVTMADNEAGSGGALHSASNGADAVRIANSILATSPSGDNCAGFALNDLGGNVQSPGATCGASIAVGDPELQALTPNPLPFTPTMALGGTSAALGIGVAAICNAPPVFSVDQRLASRPQGGPSCDAGAYESSNPDPQPGYASIPPPGGALASISTPVNVTGTTTFTVSETGNAQLNVTSVTVTGGPELTIAPGSFSIPNGGGPQTVTVSCNSDVAGTFNGTVTVVHNAPGSPAAYTVQCDVTPPPAPGYSSTPAPGSALTTITTPVNVTGTSTFTVSEMGDLQLDVTSVTVTGGPELTVAPGSFSIADGGGPQTVTVSCNSAVVGTFNGTVTVLHNATGSPATYTVQCDVTPVAAPGYGSTPAPGSALTAIATPVNVTGTTTFTVSETGDLQLDVTSVTVTGGPELTIAPGSFSIPDGGGPQTVTVSCNSAVVGTFNGTVTVLHNATGSPATYTVQCDVTPVAAPGYGSTPAPGSALTAIATPVNVTGTTTFTVSETGDLQLDVTSVTVTGGPELTIAPGSFSIPDGGGPQTVTVSCNSASVGTFNGTVTVVHNAPGSPATYTVQCDVTPAAAPGYGSAPASGNPLTAIATPVNVTGTTTFTVSETGTLQLDVTSVTVTGGPVLTVAPGSFSIPNGGGPQTVTVSCNSASVGTFNGTVTVVHNAPGSPATYTVQCDVTPVAAPGYNSIPAPGNPLVPIATPVNVTGTTTFTVSETGTLQLDVTSVTVTGGPVLTVAPGSFSIPDGGGPQTVTVSCNSASVGTFNGTVTVAHNAPGSPATYTVQCAVTPAPAPGYGSTPTPGNALTAIATAVNVTGTTTFTVSETGTLQLDVTSVTVTGGPELTIAPGSFSIPDGGGPQTVTVSCNSASVGVFNGTVTVVHNAPGSPAQYPVTCSVGALGRRGDMDQDQDPDLIFRSQTTGAMQVWMMAAENITLQTTTTPATLADLNWKLQGTADLNGDGHTDFIWRHQLSGKNVVWLMNQTTRTSGTFLNPDTLAGTNWQMVATGQFDADGKWDLLWRNGFSGKNVVWTMDGTTRLLGQFTNPDMLDTAWQVAGTGDFDGDQKSDILWQRSSDGFMTLWLMDGLNRVGEVELSPQLPPAKRPSWRIQAVEDYDGNGRPDLVWRHQLSGRLVIWFMDATGLNRLSGVFTAPVSLQPLDWKVVGPR